MAPGEIEHQADPPRALEAESAESILPFRRVLELADDFVDHFLTPTFRCVVLSLVRFVFGFETRWVSSWTLTRRPQRLVGELIDRGSEPPLELRPLPRELLLEGLPDAPRFRTVPPVFGRCPRFRTVPGTARNGRRLDPRSCLACRTPDHACRTPDHACRTSDHACRTPDHACRTSDHACRTPDHAQIMPAGP